MSKLKEYFKNSPEIFKLILFILGACCIIFVTNNLFNIFAPFIVAYVVTIVTRPLMVKLITKFRVPKLFATLICMLLILFVGILVIYFFVYQISDGIVYCINLLTVKFSNENLSYFISFIDDKIDLINNVFNAGLSLNEIKSEIYNVAMKLIGMLSTISVNIVMSVPSLIVAFLIGCIASFYMLYDFDKISSFLGKQFSEKNSKIVQVFNNEILFSVAKMVFSYALLSLICFIELVIGFMVIGIKDAWFIALIIAIIDVFPILGSGGILVPWSIIGFLMGEPMIGIGMLVLWGVIIVVRQVMEPKIVGSQIGLHPLVTIMALFIGLQTMGGIGLLMGPMYIIICKKLNEAKIIHLYNE